MENTNRCLLQIHQLHHAYGVHTVLNGLDLQLDAGQIHGVVGLNGAGKTTTLECALGLQTFAHGTITICGVQPHLLHTTQGKVAAVFDNPCLQPQLTVRQVLDYARLTCSHKHAQPAVRLEQLLGIERYTNFKIAQLSLGNRRRTAIAQALIGEPTLVILDEPFNGLDAGGVEDVLTLVQQLNQQQGTTFLLASHQLSYLERICSHMSFLHRGTIAISQTIAQLLAEKQQRLWLRTSDDVQALALLNNNSSVQVVNAAAKGQHHQGLALELHGITSAQLNRSLLQAGIDVFELIPQRISLETVFHELTRAQRHG